MNPTQKKIASVIIVIVAIIISIAWSKQLEFNTRNDDIWNNTRYWYDFSYTWYAFLLPIAGAAFALYKIFDDKK